MLLGVIADDFTGASDVANMLAKGHKGNRGLRTCQYLDVPDFSAKPEIEAGVVALKTRSVPAREAVELSLRALAWLKSQGCRQFLFKYCSTFDSTPAGNIGPVGEALAEALGTAGVVACPALPALGRTVYQGHLFVGDRLLNESGMEKHPLNPMLDADIRRCLSRQCRAPVGLADWSTVRRGPKAIANGLAEAARSKTTRNQIEIHTRTHPAIGIDVERVMNGELSSKRLVDFVLSNSGQEPLLYSSSDPAKVAAAQRRYGCEQVAAKLDALFANIACELVRNGVKRLVVAGGETSGAVVAALGLRELAVGPEIDPGVPVLFTNVRGPLALALKSGNFGRPNFFSAALARLKAGED